MYCALRLLDLLRDVARQALGRDDPRERTEAQNPSVKRTVDADVERDAHASARQVRDALRGVPLPRAHVIGGRRLKVDLDALGRARMDAERVGKRRLRQFLPSA